MKRFILLSALVVFTACQSPSKNETPDTAGGWASRMQQLSNALSTLLPMSMDPVEFNLPMNQQLIEREITKMAELSHDVNQMKRKPSKDPAYNYISKELHKNMTEAKHQLENNNRSAARELIRTTSHYCVACHTQNDKGPQFLSDNTSEYFKGLRPLVKAQYFIAVRNFDKGLSEFDKAMNSPDASVEPYQNVENTALKALAVAVRVKRDPKLAEQIVNKIMMSTWAPAYLRVNAKQWREGILEWQKEKPLPASIKNAKLLMVKGWNKSLETPMSRGGLIYFLRASSMLSDYFAEGKTGPAHAEAVFTSGLVGEALQDLNLFALSEAYYEACIRTWPNSDVARRCYTRLEGRTLGKAGVFDGQRLPRYLEEQLNELKLLAMPNGNSW